MFNIIPDPTFEAVVDVPVPGKGTLPITLVFKHKNRKDLMEFFDRAAKAESSDALVISEIVVGWKGVNVEYSVENLAELINNYHGVVKAIFDSYGTELAEGKRKN